MKTLDEVLTNVNDAGYKALTKVIMPAINDLNELITGSINSCVKEECLRNLLDFLGGIEFHIKETDGTFKINVDGAPSITLSSFNVWVEHNLECAMHDAGVDTITVTTSHSDLDCVTSFVAYKSEIGTRYGCIKRLGKEFSIKIGKHILGGRSYDFERRNVLVKSVKGAKEIEPAFPYINALMYKLRSVYVCVFNGDDAILEKEYVPNKTLKTTRQMLVQVANTIRMEDNQALEDGNYVLMTCRFDSNEWLPGTQVILEAFKTRFGDRSNAWLKAFEKNERG